MKNFGILLLGMILLFGMKAEAQNLIPNNSFELNTSIPCSPITSTAAMNNAATGWFYASTGSSDIHTSTVLTTCWNYALGPTGPGEQVPRTGDEMGGFYVNVNGDFRDYREYLEIRLSSPMVVGQAYELEMFVSRAENFPWAVNNLGMLLSTTNVYQATSGPLNRNAQLIDTNLLTQDTGWTRIYDCWVADSAYEYVVIGNFLDSALNDRLYVGPGASSSYYTYVFVDDLRIEPTTITGGTTNSHDTVLCDGAPMVLDPMAGPGGSFLWSDGSTGPTITVTTGGTYVLDVSGCAGTNTDTFHVTAYSSPTAFSLGADAVMCAGGELLVSVPDEPGVTFTWADGLSGNSRAITNPGTYILNATTICGSYSDTINVTWENCECVSFIPNAFSPNGDGLNDLFRPKMLGCDNDVELFVIFNRFGEEVYRYNQGGNIGWDGTFLGTKADNGVYVWKLMYVTNDAVEVTESGNLTLIR